MRFIKAIFGNRDTPDKRGQEKKYSSPPPELAEDVIVTKKRKRAFKYAHITSQVDSSPPRLSKDSWYRNLEARRKRLQELCDENHQLVLQIRKIQLLRGKVDCNWSAAPPSRSLQYHRNRVDFLKRVSRENLEMYTRIIETRPRVQSTSSLKQDWCRNRREIVNRAENAFVLFPPIPKSEMEDPIFAAPAGVKRPRAYMSFGIGDAIIGELCLELFTDVCPNTCHLFTELLDGDTLGHGYVGTRFFRKVPHLYWSGGDVTHNNGFGCYAPRGRSQPIGAENYHFSHSMPGLLSMRVTCDDEVCGIFNITFKALPQFDLYHIVFGRVIRPSLTYDTAKVLGSALSSNPLIQICSTRRLQDGRWVQGANNTRLADIAEIKARQLLHRQK